MRDRYDQVVASYHRCQQSGQLFDTFYDLFLASSAEVAAMFANTNFALQKLMLKESLLELLNYYCGIETVRDEVEQLGGRHRQLGVRPEHYELWLDALCKAVARHDPQYQPALGDLWREAMRPGIALMLAGKKQKV